MRNYRVLLLVNVLMLSMFLLTSCSTEKSYPVEEVLIDANEVESADLYFASRGFKNVIVDNPEDISKIIETISAGTFYIPKGKEIPENGVGGVPFYGIEFNMKDGTVKDFDFVSNNLNNEIDPNERMLGIATNDILNNVNEYNYIKTDLCALFWELCFEYAPTEVNIICRDSFLKGSL